MWNYYSRIVITKYLIVAILVVIYTTMCPHIRQTQHQAQGTSLAVLAVPVTAVAVFTYYKEGQINIKYAAIIAVFFVVGSIFGSKFALTLDQKMLKKIFAVVLLVIAGKMLLDK